MNIQATLRSHKSKEGWLEKKSPRLLVGFQKRYFTIGEDNDSIFLLYDKAPPTKEKKPKGAILLSAIEQIITKEDSKEFTLRFGGRDFVFKAQSAPIKNEWINTINFLKEYSIQKSGSIESINSSSDKKWRFDALDANRQRNLRLNLEKKNQDEDEVKEIEIKDEQMQKIKGISQYLESYNEEILSNHIVQGFLYKKKEKLSTKVVQPRQRWFFIFSQYNLCENISKQNDFDLNDLPPFIKPNILYYYDSKLDDSKRENEIHIKNIVSINKIDLKVEGDNKLKKGLDIVGNQIISAVNKFTEITKLDKIGAHIHKFEFIFQIVTKKENKEVTHNFYSGSLLQIEKWFNSLTKIKKMYDAEHLETERTLSNDQAPIKTGSKSPSRSFNKSPETGNSYADRESTTPERRSPTESSEEGDIRYKQESCANKQECGQQRNQILFKSAIKTKIRNKLKIGWKDKIVSVKRQIIEIYNNEKDANDEKQEDYILIKDIEKINLEKNHSKIRIETLKHDQRSFKLKNEPEAQLWLSAIRKLMENENTPLEELHQVPKPTRDDCLAVKKLNAQCVSINDTKSECDAESSSKCKKQSFQSLDDVLYRGYQSNKPDNQVRGRKQTFLSKIFGCCIDPRQDDLDAEQDFNRSSIKKTLIS